MTECMDCHEAKPPGEMHSKIPACWDCIHLVFLAGPGRDRGNAARKGQKTERKPRPATGPRKKASLTPEEIDQIRRVYGIAG